MAGHSIVRPGEDDDEWEYEYDTNETEDFYFKLDLAGSIPPEAPKKAGRGRKRGRVKQESATKRKKPKNVKEQDADKSDDSSEAEDDEDNGPQVDAEGRQIISLANEGTGQPIVMVNGKTFACRWAFAMGTDMYFKDTTSDSENPAHELLAATPLRLVAQPTELKPRDRPLPAPVAMAENPLPAQDVPIAPTFLARLASIKAARGNTDEVPLTISKTKTTSQSSKTPRKTNGAAKSLSADADDKQPAAS